MIVNQTRGKCWSYWLVRPVTRHPGICIKRPTQESHAFKHFSLSNQLPDATLRYFIAQNKCYTSSAFRLNFFFFWISFEWSCLFFKKINWNFFFKSFQVNSTRSLRWAHRWWRHHHQQQLGNSSPCLHIDTDLQALICIAHE